MTERADAPDLSAEETLAVIEEQRYRVGRDLAPDPVLLYVTWGLAWVLGFTAFYLVMSGAVDTPWWAAGIVFFALILVAMVVTTVRTARAASGVRGVSAQVGAMYGWSWALGFAALSAVNAGLIGTGLSGDQIAMLWSSTPLLLVGVLYLAGGALWRDPVQYGLGAWVLATGSVSVFAGVPGNYLALAIAGGGGFLVAAAWFGWRRQRAA